MGLNTSYPKPFSSRGEVQQLYSIMLTPGPVSFFMKMTKRILLPLVGKVKEQLQYMESMGKHGGAR